MKCAPAFLVAGGFQSGAASLARKLQGHRHVAWGPGSTAQFWAEWGRRVEGATPSSSS